MTTHWRFVCALCDRPAFGLEEVVCESCGGSLVATYDTLPRRLADAGGRGVWRYRSWLPIGSSEVPVTLGEGATPLVHIERWSASLGLHRVYAKLEFAGPTGSFKDRGASVLVSHAVVTGARRIIEDSSGNAGASIAAYSARAGLTCGIQVPDSTPQAKLAQIRAYGADVFAVAGSREDVAAAAVRSAAGADTYYAGHNANPYFVEGMKTFALELIEDLGMKAPDHVIMPVGGGSLYCGAALGFWQARAAGLNEAIPRLHLVQANGCMPLVAASNAGSGEPLSVVRHKTVAGGITIENPIRGSLILRILRATRGAAVAVQDREILAAQAELAEQDGIFMEPTSAAAFAGLAKLAMAGQIRPNETVAVAVTGSGLKDAPIPAP